MSVILARKILWPNPLVCIGVGEPDCLQTLEKTHGEIQNSAEESHWGISRKSVCAAGVVFSSELPPSHHSHHRHLLQSLDRLRPTKPVWSSSSCLPPPPPSPRHRPGFVPRDGLVLPPWLLAGPLPQCWTLCLLYRPDQPPTRLYWTLAGNYQHYFTHNTYWLILISIITTEENHLYFS